jgi:hypothetical protein
MSLLKQTLKDCPPQISKGDAIGPLSSMATLCVVCLTTFWRTFVSKLVNLHLFLRSVTTEHLIYKKNISRLVLGLKCMFSGMFNCPNER